MNLHYVTHNFFTLYCIWHLPHLVHSAPGSVVVLQGTKLYRQMPSNLMIYIIITEALLPHIILDRIYPSLPGQPSLTRSLYPHISHHYNISLSVSSVDMIILLNSAPPHAHSYPFHIGLFPKFALILHMAFQVCAMNVAQRLHLD